MILYFAANECLGVKGLSFIVVSLRMLDYQAAEYGNHKCADSAAMKWVKHCNQVRSHSALGYRPSAPQAQVPQMIKINLFFCNNLL